MPPKQQAPNKKSQEKLKNKIIEDKTFGLKNKKGAKQQKFIQQVQKQVQNKMAPKNPRDMMEDLNKKKEEEKKKKEEIAALFKPVLTQTVAKGVDPKSVVCVYFKQNLCQKGDKCKFSHDLSIERKSEKRNIYEDTREADTMENWDEEKLEDVVNRKHGEDNVKKNQTQIVCKYFIEAVENKTYGWFWSCPNGETCIYRHALPPGFTLKSEMKKKDDEEEVSLELLIEKERASLGTKTTRVTLETFLAWKARKVQEKKDEKKKSEEKKMKDYKLGFMNGLTGRDIFTFNPDLITNDDEDAQADIDYRRREDDDEDEQIIKQCRELNPEYFAAQASEVDGTGTLATDDRFSYLEGLLAKENERQRRKQEEADAAAAAAAAAAEEEDEDEEAGDEEDDDEDGEEEGDENEEEDEEEEKEKLKKMINNNNKAGGGKAAAAGKLQNGIEIDESLFNLEELQDLDEELEKLEV